MLSPIPLVCGPRPHDKDAKVRPYLHHRSSAPPDPPEAPPFLHQAGSRATSNPFSFSEAHLRDNNKKNTNYSSLCIRNQTSISV